MTFNINRDGKLGFCSFSIGTCLGLYIVWGWRGNCYAEDNVLRLDVCPDPVNWFLLTFRRRYMETTLYARRVKRTGSRPQDMRPVWLRLNWNSEHLAYHYGRHVQPELGENYPDHFEFRSRVLGHHYYV